MVKILWYVHFHSLNWKVSGRMKLIYRIRNRWEMVFHIGGIQLAVGSYASYIVGFFRFKGAVDVFNKHMYMSVHGPQLGCEEIGSSLGWCTTLATSPSCGLRDPWGWRSRNSRAQRATPESRTVPWTNGRCQAYAKRKHEIPQVQWVTTHQCWCSSSMMFEMLFKMIFNGSRNVLTTGIMVLSLWCLEFLDHRFFYVL